MHEEVIVQLIDILGRIPTGTGLTSDEIRLEVAARIVEEFPKGVHADTDADLKKAAELIFEAGVYYAGTVHPEDAPESVEKENKQ